MARIIYVEDDDLMGDLVKDALSSKGHLIGVVPHGTLGFETIAFKKPDLVIVDMSLPGMTGIEIIRELRKLPATYLTPILMLTANTESNLPDDAIAAGASGFMKKPFSAHELIEQVSRILDQNAYLVHK